MLGILANGYGGAPLLDEYLVPSGIHHSGEKVRGNYTLTVPTDLQPGEGVTLTIYTVDSPVELEYSPLFLQTIQPEAGRSRFATAVRRPILSPVS